MTKNIRFVPTTDGNIEIRAKRKDTGKYDTLGYCHPLTVPMIKKDGVKAHMSLIRFAGH